MRPLGIRYSRVSGRVLGRVPAFGTALLVLVLGLGGAVAGCSSSDTSEMTPSVAPASTSAAPASVAPASVAPAAPAGTAGTVPMGDMHMPTGEEVTSTWMARPGYVDALPAAGQGAYAFALARPDVLQWLPCYCGCGGMGHRSNLDCFFQRREVKGTYQFEEHASFCDICVKTANLASQMIQQGSTMTQIRAAVDSSFGGGAAPGTDTAQPPT